MIANYKKAFEKAKTLGFTDAKKKVRKEVFGEGAKSSVAFLYHMSNKAKSIHPGLVDSIRKHTGIELCEYIEY